MTLNTNTLAERIRQAREAAGLTQAQVATALGLSRPAVSQLESGERRVSSLELLSLARLFARDPAEFLEEEFDPSRSLLAAFRTVAAELDVESQHAVVTYCVEVARATRHLEGLLGIVRPEPPAMSGVGPAPRGTWEAVRQGEEAAVAERRRLALGFAPLPDLVDLLESQGVRAAQLPLPEDVDGLALRIPDLGPFIVVRKDEQNRARRRFSFAHEYGHILLDGPARVSVTHAKHQDDPREKRANAFAAGFLLPEQGVREFLAGLGKSPRRSTLEVMEGQQVYSMRNTEAASADAIQPHDVVQLSHYFGASDTAVLYRLGNLGYLSSADRERLWQEKEEGHLTDLHRALFSQRGADRPARDEPDEFRHRFLALVLEALRLEEISDGRAVELAGLVGVSREVFRDIQDAAGIPVSAVDAVLPDAPE